MSCAKNLGELLLFLSASFLFAQGCFPDFDTSCKTSEDCRDGQSCCGGRCKVGECLGDASDSDTNSVTDSDTGVDADTDTDTDTGTDSDTDSDSDTSTDVSSGYYNEAAAGGSAIGGGSGDAITDTVANRYDWRAGDFYEPD
jgi:hypothetical protein